MDFENINQISSVSNSISVRGIRLLTTVHFWLSTLSCGLYAGAEASEGLRESFPAPMVLLSNAPVEDSQFHLVAVVVERHMSDVERDPRICFGSSFS